MPKHKQKENEESSRTKILDAAEKIFAEKGYDGARVGKIGKAAGVNPALLYYYYDSKEDILNELMGRAILETTSILDKSFEKITVANEMVMDDFINEIVGFLEKKQQVLKIMFIELLKSGQDNYYIFELLDPIYEKVSKKIKELGGNIGDKSLFLSQMFFIFTTPIIMHVTVGNKWSKYNKISAKKTKSMLFKIFKQLIGGMIFETLK